MEPRWRNRGGAAHRKSSCVEPRVGGGLQLVDVALLRRHKTRDEARLRQCPESLSRADSSHHIYAHLRRRAATNQIRANRSIQMHIRERSVTERAASQVGDPHLALDRPS